jgi:hypothetical protein
MTNDLPLMSSDAAAVLDVLFPSEATGYVEVRTITRGGEIRIREFFEVEDAARAYRRCRLVGRFDNIYVSVAPRVREEGLKSAVEVAFAVWADLDRCPRSRNRPHFWS